MWRESEKEGKRTRKQNIKLRDSAISDKSIGNPMNKVNFVNPMNKVIIATTRKQYLKLLFRPAFKRQKQFRNEVIAIEKEKCTKNLKKPIYTGTKS